MKERKRERMSFQKDVNQKGRTINTKKKDIKSGKRGKYKKRGKLRKKEHKLHKKTT